MSVSSKITAKKESLHLHPTTAIKYKPDVVKLCVGEVVGVCTESEVAVIVCWVGKEACEFGADVGDVVPVC